MATGYDEDGSIDRLICVSPPDGGVGESGGGGPTSVGPLGFIPNVFMSGSETWNNDDVINVGIQDLAIELWAITFGQGFLNDITGVSLIRGGAEKAGINLFHNVGGNDPQVRGSFARIIPPGGALVGTPILVEAGWHYYVANFDRSGNGTLYADGVLIDTWAIAAGVADNHVNWTVRICNGGYNAQTSCSFAIGPIAIHINTLLTDAQMRDSFRRKHVQNLGVATTMGLWNPRRVEGVTGWELSAANVDGGAHMFGLVPSREVPINWAAPEAPPDSVFIPDESGNDRSLTARFTLASYTPGVLTHADHTMGADPFFR